MEKSGQPHDLAALASGKKFLVLIGFNTMGLGAGRYRGLSKHGSSVVQAVPQ
jgi:hypothetical protein